MEPYPMKWFRMYNEVLNDPKVQLLHPKAFKAWVALLCVANEGTPRGRIDPETLPYFFRMDQETTDKMVEHFLEKKLLEREGDKLVPHNWDERQFASDNATERTRKHRGNVSGNARGNTHGNSSGTPTGTVHGRSGEHPQRTDTETDTETENPPSPPRGAVQEDPAFETFWSFVVRREPGKTKAREAWDKALSRGADPQAIIDGIRAARPAHLAAEDKTKVPHITTWLNQHRWEEVPAMPGESPQEAAASTRSPEEEAKHREELKAESERLEAARIAERERLDKIAKEATEKLQAEQAELVRQATEDPERPSNVDPAIWAHIHPDRRGPYAAAARRELELAAQEAAWVAARQAEEPTA